MISPRSSAQCVSLQTIFHVLSLTILTVSFTTFLMLLYFRQIMFHIEKAHYIVDEMVANGVIVENNKCNILRPLALMDIIIDK